MNVDAVFCSQCGSTDVSLLTKDTGVCNHCGVKFVISQKPADAPRVFVINALGKAKKSATQGRLEKWVLREAWSSEQFAREAYIKLFADEKTPLDIDKANFAPVTTELPQFTVFFADYMLKYTVDIGHNRKEQYIERERQTVDGRVVYKNVVKERTATDWSPFSGEFKREKVITVGTSCLPDKKDIYSDFEKSEILQMQQCLRNTSLRDAVAYEESGYSVEVITPNKADIQRAMTVETEVQALLCQKELPGDTSRQFKYTASAKEEPGLWLLAPEYALGFEYDGKPYEMRGFTAEKRARLSNIPRLLWWKAAAENIKKDMQQQKKKTLWIPLIAIGALLLLLSLTDMGNGAAFLTMLLALGGFAYWWLHNRYWLRKEAEVEANVKKEGQKEKLDKLEKLLSSMGAEPLSAEERDLFEV